MRNDSELAKRNLELGFEFSRFLLVRPELEESIPENALVIFEVDDDPEITRFNHELARLNKEPNQPVIIVRIKGLAPTRLIEPTVISASA
jgi:hypothetical protein